MYPIDLEVLDSVDTPIGNTYLSRRRLERDPSTIVYDVHIEGDLLMSSISPVSEQKLATSALSLHRGEGELCVLVGGLGLGYTAQAALSSPRVRSLQVVDKMDFVINWMRKGLLPLSGELTRDPRLAFVLGDVYADLLGPPSTTFDIILVDVDHEPERPLDPASLPFYTREGQRAVAQHLSPGGILGVWSCCDNEPFFEVMREVYAEATREHVRWDSVETERDAEPFHNVLFFGRRP